MPDFTLRLLHLSDLHERGSREKEIWRKRRVLGDEWLRHLETIQEDGPIDLVCFTGDAADWGLAEEFEKATELFEATLTGLGLSWDRFFVVPGNHDIHRKTEEGAWKRLRPAALSLPRLDASRWMAGRNLDRRFGATQREKLLARQANYRSWLTTIGRADLLPDPVLHPHLGYRQPLRLPGHPFEVHVIGLDSAWLCGDNHDADKLLLTQNQIGQLCTGPDGNPLPGYRLVLIHHPLDHLADAAEARRLLGDHADLVLRGHLHEPEISTWADRDRRLRQIAAGCLYEGHGADQCPNACEVVEIRLDTEGRPLRYDLRFRGWSSRGYWFDDDSLHRESRGGRLVWSLSEPIEESLANPRCARVFVGRRKELEELRNILIRKDQAPVCAVTGMAGVGKSYLIERFSREEITSFPGGNLRLALDPQKPSSPEVLLAELADRLGLRVSGRDLMTTLRGRLRSPRTLLHLENVDSPAAERVILQVLRRLNGCTVVVTGRIWDLGREVGWHQVWLDPFNEAEALEQLRLELEKEPSESERTEYRELVKALGQLPLAVHLAAAYLRADGTPQGFRRRLQENGFDLGPSASHDRVPEDPETARQILRRSFYISLAILAEDLGNESSARLIPALHALAYAPPTGFGRSLGSAIAGISDNEFEELLMKARTLSLIFPVPREERPDGAWRLHPLLGELLRRETQGTAVFERITEWILRRLPRLGPGREAEQGRRWREVQSEQLSLITWLGQVPPRLRPSVERIGAAYARSCGPFHSWIEFYERALDDPLSDVERSNCLGTLASLALRGGLPDRAVKAAREKISLDSQRGVLQDAANAWGTIADVLQMRGDLEGAIRIRREEQLPIFERMGEIRARAVVLGKIADILQIQKNLDEALAIRREEELPVYERFGDARAVAVTYGKIADILHVQGEFDEALEIRRTHQLPVFARIGDIRSKAVTFGRISDLYRAQGQLDEAIRLREEEELPVLLRLGGVRDLLIARANLGVLHLARNQEGDRESGLDLFRSAIEDAERLCLPEGKKIRDLLEHFKEAPALNSD